MLPEAIVNSFQGSNDVMESVEKPKAVHGNKGANGATESLC